MRVSWHSFDLRSGRRGPRVVTQQLGTLHRIIGEPTSVELSVSCWDDETQAAQPEWESATLPGRTMLVAIDEQDSEQILWGGMVLRQVSGPGQWVSTQVMTLEHYLDRRFVGDLTFTGVDQASIAAGIVGDVAVDGLDFTVDAPASGTVRDRTYLDDEDKTALSLLTELMDVEDGPEFTVDLEWADADHTLLRKVFRVRDRLGTSAEFPTRWTMPGCLTDFEFVVDFTEQFGANDVVAISSGEGEARPESAHQQADALLDGGWARFDERFTPSTSITNVETLNAHARERLAMRKTGLSELTVTATVQDAPRLGGDWWMGDDIDIDLTCARFPAQRDPDGELWPGFSRRMRAVGWKLDLDAGLLQPLAREV